MDNCLFCGVAYCKKQETQKFCGTKCKNKYNYRNSKNGYINNKNKREVMKARSNIWAREHPEKVALWRKGQRKRLQSRNPDYFKEAAKRQYKKDKDKWVSRIATRNILNGTGYNKFYLEQICAVCNSRTNLEIHHEVYPTKRAGIVKAIKDKKIYYLCKKCHRAKTKEQNKKKTDKKKQEYLNIIKQYNLRNPKHLNTLIN